jgi:sec-independent protein translocase protein TatA
MISAPILLGNIFGPGNWLIILGIILLLFGANRLPDLMRSLGRSVTEFKKGINDPSDEEGEAAKKIDKP